MRETLKDVTVTDEEVAAYYEENKQQFTKGETVSAKHILVDSEEKCTSVLESITSGEKAFEDAAKEASTCHLVQEEETSESLERVRWSKNLRKQHLQLRLVMW